MPSRLCEEVNAAFRAHDHVIIYFLVRALKGMYGVARMGYVRTYTRALSTHLNFLSE